MKNSAWVGIAAVIAATGMPAWGLTGNKVLEVCRDFEVFQSGRPSPSGNAVTDAANAGVCVGYIDGVTSGIAVGSGLAGRLLYCSPNGVTNQQHMRIVINALKAAPESLHEDAVGVATVALIKAFPCTK